ncbi:hypothetical protein [Microbacterium jejuense]|uniref:hypothetical protein n=1 Tax=Microbacterium jejuense TaxID=1263637 RepID=UPI0031E90F98
MRYAISYDRGAWYPVPTGFPTAEWADVAEWREGLIADFEEDTGSLDDDARDAVRELADTARAAHNPRASEVLLFCPRRLLEFGIASVYCGTFEDVAAMLGRPVTESLDELVRDDAAEIPPVVVPFETAELGEGRRAAIVLADEDGRAEGAFNYVFRRDDHLVFVTAVADRIGAGAIMLPFVDELVRGIRLEPDDAVPVPAQHEGIAS